MTGLHRLGLPAAALLSSLAVGVRAGAFDAWTYRADLTFSGYDGTTELTDFPVLVRLDSIPEFSYSQLADSNGGDLRFGVLGGDEELPYEIDTWNPGGASYIWVRVPSISGPETVIRAYWGNSAASVPAYTTDGSTWSNGYAAVYHFNETSGMLLDATTNANDSTNVVGNVLYQQQGMIGAAYQFDGSGDYVAIPDSATLDGGNALSIEAWERYDDSNLNATRAMISKRASSTTSTISYDFYLSAGLKLHANVGGDNGGGRLDKCVATAPGWHYLACTFDGTVSSVDQRLLSYLDGAYTGAVRDKNSTVKNNTYPLLIGRHGGSTKEDWNGALDEIRISTVARSADWMRASWQTVAANAEFCTYGVTVDTRLPLGLTDAASDIVAAGATLNGMLLETPSATTVTVFWGRTDGGSNPAAWEFSHTFEAYDGDLPAAFPYTAAGLAADSVWYVRHRMVNSAGEYWTRDADIFINGGISVAATAASAAEEGLVPGEFTFTRPSGTETYDAVVAYAVTGTATADEDYAALSGSVTIPAGELGASVAVVPIWDYAVEGPETVRVDLLPGAYASGASTSAELVLLDCPPPSAGTTNVWVGAGSASTPENWSLGHVPTASENVLLTGYSVSDMTWDGAALPASVASWTQSADFTGAVDLTAAYNAEAPALIVDGDAVIDGGTWTCAGRAATETTKLYMRVLGNLTVGPSGAISVTGQGFKETSGPGYVDGGAAHAGEASTANSWSKTYGSVFHPDRWGSGCGNYKGKYYGGGLLQLEVAGVLTVDGQIAADGTGNYNNHGAGSGGSIRIDAASLAGTGSIHADGGMDDWSGNAGAGRIAIHLTAAGALPSDYAGTVTTYGKGNQKYNQGSYEGGAGTVYWRLSNEPEGTGTVIVRNPYMLNRTSTVRRSCQLPPALGPVEDYSRSRWIVQENAQLKLTAGVKVESLAIEAGSNANSAAKIHLNNQTLRTKALTILGTSYPAGTYLASDLPAAHVLDGDGEIPGEIIVLPSYTVILLQ